MAAESWLAIRFCSLGVDAVLFLFLGGQYRLLVLLIGKSDWLLALCLLFEIAWRIYALWDEIPNESSDAIG